MCQFLVNPHRQTPLELDLAAKAAFDSSDILKFHRSIPGYKETPLVSLPILAQRLGVRDILVKDESFRFDLNAFKVLGASYAICRFFKERWQARFAEPLVFSDLFNRHVRDRLEPVTFCTATDGNHGRAVAWIASQMGCDSFVYVPGDTVRARVRAIENEGATVVVVNGTYDDTVSQVARDSATNGWQIISDTAYPGYTTVPLHVMAGYSTLFSEIDRSLAASGTSDVDFLFLQSGVGSLAAAATWHYRRPAAPAHPRLVSVEPLSADCLMESARSQNGELRSTRCYPSSIMAGLNCGTPSLVAWPIIRQGIDVFMSMSDCYSEEAVRTFYYPEKTDPRLISGESGAAGLAGLLALCSRDSFAPAREALDLNSDSRILIINTEGATDPVSFEKIVKAATD
jgi:diaminopropionate ammonia-lyase